MKRKTKCFRCPRDWVKKKFFKKLKRRRKLEARKAVFGASKFQIRSPLISLLLKRGGGRLVGKFDRDKREWFLPIPKKFSLLTNPDESLDVILTLAQVGRRREVDRVYFDHTKCEEMDLGASVVLDVTALELQKEWDRSLRRKGFAGIFPVNPQVKEMFICTGLYRTLGLKVARDILDKHVIFPLFAGRKSSRDESRGSTDSGRASTGLVEHINKCLGFAGYRLSDEGDEKLARWAGEIIDNAEQHSGRTEWYVIAHMGKSPDSIHGDCHLAVFNFGQSIFESLNHVTTPEVTKRSFNVLADKHRARGFFQQLFSGKHYCEEDLWTLYALQERVSRFNGVEGCFDRGTGTVDMIEAFQTFGGSTLDGEKPMMTIISGGSRIKFDGKYRLGFRTNSSGESHQVIAFNSENDLDERPDPDCVHSLRSFFPGTIISFQFFVDQSHLAATPKHVAKND